MSLENGWSTSTFPIVDRLGLEQASCESYKLMKSESDRWG